MNMNDGFQYFDIIVFAMVAAFLVFRLRSVLGRRTGTERPRDPFAKRGPELGRGDKTGAGPTGKVVSLADAVSAKSEDRPADAAAPVSVANGLAQIRSADPKFDASAFLQGARGAFEIIVHAFASGDTASLRPLLSDEVYDHFSDAIRQRNAAKETQQTNLVSIKSTEIESAELTGRTGFVTVKFVSDQVNVTRAEGGAIVDGSEDHVTEKVDFWTFARNTRSSDPNWHLVGTRSA